VLMRRPKRFAGLVAEGRLEAANGVGFAPSGPASATILAKAQPHPRPRYAVPEPARRRLDLHVEYGPLVASFGVAPGSAKLVGQGGRWARLTRPCGTGRLLGRLKPTFEVVVAAQPLTSRGHGPTSQSRCRSS